MLISRNIPKTSRGYGSRLTDWTRSADVKSIHTLVTARRQTPEKVSSPRLLRSQSAPQRQVGDEIEVVPLPLAKKNSTRPPGHHTHAITFWLFRASYSANRGGPHGRIYELGSRPGPLVSFYLFRLSVYSWLCRAHVAQRGISSLVSG